MPDLKNLAWTAVTVLVIIAIANRIAVIRNLINPATPVA
jgi:hypothetical protein